jgi:hypothetical protein
MSPERLTQEIGDGTCTCSHKATEHEFPVPPYRIHQVGAPCTKCGCVEYEELTT